MMGWKRSVGGAVPLIVLGLLLLTVWSWAQVGPGPGGVTTATPVFRRVPFLTLGTPINGTLVYCTDCTAATNPCTAGGSGAFAARQNSAWVCLDSTGVASGTSAPADALYWLGAPNTTLVNGLSLASFTGLVMSTAGVPGAWGGSGLCVAGTYVTDIAGDGSTTCEVAAPASVRYWVGAADATLSAEENLGSLTGLVLTTAGSPSAYAGTVCSNSFPRSLSAVGAANCSTIVLSADVSGNLGVANLNGGASASSTTFWRGDGTWAQPTGGSGAPTDALYWVGAPSTTLTAELSLASFTALVVGSGGTPSAYGGTVCSNAFARSLSALGVGNCSSVNAALDLTGVLALANGGTGLSTATGDTVMVSSGTTWVAEAVPNCGEGGTLNYATATNTFSCLTDASGSGNFEIVSLSFDAATMQVLSTSTVNAGWVSATSVILCSPQATTDDGQTVENYYVTPFHLTVSNLVAATSFDLTALNPTGAAGVFRFGCTGS